MKLFKSDLILLSRASPVKAGKRFVSFFIDFLIVFIFSYLVFLGGFQITKGSDAYVNAGKIVDTEIKYYNDLFSETKVFQFIDEEKTTRKDSDIMVLESVSRQIYRAYTTFGNSEYPNWSIENSERWQEAINKYGIADVETESIPYFYVKYIPNHEEMKIVNYKDGKIEGKEIKTYLFDLYKSSFDENKDMFVYDETKYDIPILKTEVSYNLYCYLFDENAEESNKEKGKTYYSSYYSAYSYMLEDAERKMIVSEPYYTEHYLVYSDNYYKQGKYANITIIVSIMIGYLIGILIPKLVFKDDRTFGRLIMRLGVINDKKEKTKWYVMLIKTILGMCGFVTTSILMYLLPPFSGVYDFMMMPLIGNSGSITMLTIVLFLSLLGIGLYVSTLFTHNKVSLLDLVFHEHVVDKHHIDEGDFDDQYEGKAI